VAALALGGRVRSVDAEPVPLPGPDSGRVAVPDEAGALGKVVVALPAGIVEEAQLDPGRGLGEEREVRAVTVVSGAEGGGAAGAEFHAAQPSARAVRVPEGGSAHLQMRLAPAAGRADRQPQPCPRPPAIGAVLERQRAVMQLRDLPAEREADAGSLGL